MINKCIREYQKIDVNTEILEADPHKIIQLLMKGFLDQVAYAKGHVLRKNISEKSISINKALDILQGLMLSLNFEKGGDVAKNLFQLYSYIEEKLYLANKNNDIAILEEVTNHMLKVKSGWDAIPDQIKEEYAMAMENKE